jgi:uncharacterized membrane protein YhaH (DUF805 family)
MNFGNLLFSYEGRINRAKWWLGLLIYLVALLISGVLLVVPLLGIILAVVVYIAVFVSSIMLGIKRLHDRDKSGWWLLLFIGAPVVLGGIQLAIDPYLEGGAAPMLLTLASLAISVWFVVELGCLRGTVGPNQYGPDPLPPRT